MDQMELIVREVLSRLAGSCTGQEKKIPAETSARHVHLSLEDLRALCGQDQLEHAQDISQPGQFLSTLRVRLIGPKGILEHVAVLGPLRKATQVEISATDARLLGINAPVRLSGELSDAAAISLQVGSQIITRRAAIVARRHLHMTPADAAAFGVTHGQEVSVRVLGSRPLVLESCPVRVSDAAALALHMDTDAVVTKILGGVLVLPQTHMLIRHAELPMEKARVRARSTCIQCRTCTDLCPRYLLGHPIYPHLSMRAFASGAQRLEVSALLCMECGVCELYACPMGLNPRRVQQMMKAELRAQGEKHTFALKDAPALAAHHSAPSGRVQARIHALDYEIPVPEEAVEATASTVYIPLKQHIGVPAEPVVAAGQRVSRGDVIGRMAEGALGADVHASICGTVQQVEQGRIVICGCG